MREFGKFGPLIGAIDEGTSNVKFLIFAANTSEVLTYHQVTLKRFSPQEGWVEQDALEILNAVIECIEVTADNLRKLDINPEDVVGIGITNQRETTIAWNSVTGQPLYSAIVWLDVRTSKIVDELTKTKGAQCVHAVTQTSGLPLSTYFSSVKLKWLLQNVTAVKEAVDVGECMAGTVDSWLIWNLTGGVHGGIHATDVTNASRTQLMSLRSLQWDKSLLRFFNIPPQILPKIKSSAEIYGYISSGPLLGVPIAGCLGDQQAALVGQGCMRFGQVKCTFGTGCFLLYNTGDSIVHSQNGLLTTVAYKLGPDAPPVYALEGSVAIAGDTLQWLQQGLEIMNDVSDTEAQAGSVDDEEDGSICFVPAFNGLYSPHWRKDARGVMCGLTSKTRREHIVRAALEAVCHQTQSVTTAMAADCAPLHRLLADGGMAQNTLFMQMQADILGIPVIRPLMMESTSLGVAIVAGRALRVWPTSTPSPPADTFIPAMTSEEREIRRVRWETALEKCMGWVTDSSQACEVEPLVEEPDRTTAVLPPGLFFIGTALLMIIADKLKSL
ncbi:glycerol kinase-like isoform X2 [Pectinophora gossypiella]|uniref:glycerol kinase-like isoform X2 n=1 Tax=Pectinophora gossypiella TaxID=13191 RepID=UPI00214E4EB1|nr:glycerol kinase-like isoform X2 [Pectinophora gossypiella]